MTIKEEFHFFTNQLLEHAVKEFKETEQYPLLQEKLEQMEQDSDNMFTKSEKDFVFECFELLADINSREEQYVYHKGLSDCVKLLKWLGVLA